MIGYRKLQEEEEDCQSWVASRLVLGHVMKGECIWKMGVPLGQKHRRNFTHPISLVPGARILTLVAWEHPRSVLALPLFTVPEHENRRNPKCFLC